MILHQLRSGNQQSASIFSILVTFSSTYIINSDYIIING